MDRALRKHRSLKARKRRNLAKKIKETILKRFYADKRHLREKYQKKEKTKGLHYLLKLEKKDKDDECQ